ncbi:unnamed protein product, partial [Rotaria sp. Silwood1]
MNIDSITNILNNFTFDILQQMGVSSNQLYLWSAPIDLIKDYQYYLNMNETKLASNIFYNCTRPWFGRFCHYRFDSSTSFDEIVLSTIGKNYDKIENDTCYNHIKCDRGGGMNFCLDWREICDGSIDCLNGLDEANCSQLEENQCDENQFRCQNGFQCIPKMFVADDVFDADCLDRSDEKHKTYKFPTERCPTNPAFRCEESLCQLKEDFREWPCGDGSCVSGYYRCQNGRDKRLRLAMIKASSVSLSEVCIQALNCMQEILPTYEYNEECQRICSSQHCLNVAVKEHCPPLFDFTIGFTSIGRLHFIYYNQFPNVSEILSFSPDFICMETDRQCTHHQILSINGSLCWNRSVLNLHHSYKNWLYLLRQIQLIITDQCLSSEEIQCSKILYHCINSTKCISKHRILDGIRDCRLGDDEECSLHNSDLYPCPNENDEQIFDNDRFENRLTFSAICDGYYSLTHINATDETECELWQCNNTYTHCDGFWTCLNGLDEVNCPSSHCLLPLEHECVSLTTFKLTCLHISRVNDNIDDCVGGTDERQLCQTQYPLSNQYLFRCANTSICISKHEICNQRPNCPLNDDENFCSNDFNKTSIGCSINIHEFSKEKKFLCTFGEGKVPRFEPSLRLDNLPIFPIPTLFIRQKPMLNFPKTTTLRHVSLSKSSPVNLYCNRGIPVRIRTLDDKHYECLCPPAYYGDTCQFQNERVSLTLGIRAPSNWRIVFSLILTLVTDDEQQSINSEKQIDYLAFRDCNASFDLYLLYASRPKDVAKNYSIKIDAFIKQHTSTVYYASWHYPIPFIFLPVNRMSLLIFIPLTRATSLQQCSLSCIHGQCYRYVNTNNLFCRCNAGWSGAKCNIKYECDCSLDSTCVGVYNNQSICVCPLNKFGPHCLLTRPVCQINSCFNGGICVAANVHIAENGFICICPDGFFGQRCEQIATRIEITFDHEMSIPSNLLLHLVTAISKNHPKRVTFLTNIPVYETSAIVFVSIPFHIVFAQIEENYFLIAIQTTSNETAFLSTKVQPSYQCLSMSIFFNETIMKLPLIRRIKYYHVPCVQQKNLACFYDMTFICICDLYHRSNCFKFNHSLSHDCKGINYCENDAQCLQDDSECPSTSACVCTECHYGSRCQFSSNSTGISLDIILGSHIRPNVSFRKQTFIIKISLIVNIVMFVVGIISGLLCVLTFQGKTPREIGCGYYLYASSITSLMTMTLFVIKFWLLLLSQMTVISNRKFLSLECIIIDFLLRTCLSTDNWLNACVAIQRLLSVILI